MNAFDMPLFSKEARSLWAKKSRNGDLLWLSLPTHLMDAAEVASLLWRQWVPDGVKKRIVSGMKNGTEEDAEKMFIFLSASHDIGKATPAFASKECGYRELDDRIFEQIIETKLLLKEQQYFMYRSKTPHALASQVLLHNAGCPISVAVILGAHHGRPPDLSLLENDMDKFPENYYVNNDGKFAWHEVQQELIEYALTYSGYKSMSDLSELDICAQVLYSGLLIVVDWIASDPTLFPYMRLDDPTLPDSKYRASLAWEQLGFSYPWEADNRWMNTDLYDVRFGIQSPYPIQKMVSKVMERLYNPGIIVIEAPMGMGKTEAALVAAEILANKTKRKGVFFALPTQATSDGIFPRILDWVSRLETDEAHSIHLMHGKAQFNQRFQDLANGLNIDVDEEIGTYVHEWFTGRKRAMLDDFVVGTIDQLLLAALKQKHVMLRHLGLANKVVVIDECHAFDAYMNCYLERALNWLGEYGVPVVVLSATLPAEKRKMVIEAYCGKKFLINSERKVKNPFANETNGIKNGQTSQVMNPQWLTTRAYPVITYTDGEEVRQEKVPSMDSQKKVAITWLDDEAIVDQLSELLTDGGCAGVIVNTVRRAQELARILSDSFGDDVVQLLHSRLLTPDRIKKEEKLMDELGKSAVGRARPNLRIVVGTQVLEQSLDIDFDLLMTDLCPIDLLLQRIGRLHRHNRQRPPRLQQPKCLITGACENAFDGASIKIYSQYLLMRTKACLPEYVQLPEDIPDLVQDVYDSRCSLLPDSDDYRKAEFEYNQFLQYKRDRADAFRMQSPKFMTDMIRWLSTDVSDKSGEASVRDTEDTIEVLLIRWVDSSTVGFLPWIEQGMTLDRHHEPPAEIARKLACCSVRLPVAVSGKYQELDHTIKLLEQMNREVLGAWQLSPWLRGELFLILDEHMAADLGKFRLSYHPKYGLDYTVKEEEVKGED